MYTTARINGLSTLSTRIAALALFAAGTTLGLQAQQTQVAENSAPVDIRSLLSAPMSLSASSDLNYSSSVGVEETDAAMDFMGGNADQPPPRRSYGRHTNYNDSTHNADGSNKYGFMVGGGFTLPTGGTHNYYGTSYAFQAGGGRFFNKNFGVMLNFNWANFGVQTSTLNNLLAIYNQPSIGGDFTSLGGYGHVWSFSLDPIYNVLQGDKTGVYVTGGVGFYHKITTFTTPTLGTYCDYFYGCFTYQANQPIDSYTSNAFGIDGGVGFTYRFSQFGGERFFAEARYVYTANSKRPYYDGTTGTAPANGQYYFNVFPQNSSPTTFIPVTFGVRF
jgi:hypothetical protein